MGKTGVRTENGVKMTTRKYGTTCTGLLDSGEIMIKEVLEMINKLLYRIHPEHHEISIYGPSAE